MNCKNPACNQPMHTWEYTSIRGVITVLAECKNPSCDLHMITKDVEWWEATPLDTIYEMYDNCIQRKQKERVG